MEKESNKWLVCVVIVLLITVGVCVGYIVKLKDDIGNKSNIEEKDIKKDLTEKEITNSYVLKELEEKIAILNLYEYDFAGNATKIYSNNISNSDISEGKKLYMILLYNDNNKKFNVVSSSTFTNLTGENITGWEHENDNKPLTDYYINEIDEKYHYISAKEIEDQYKKLFGSLPTGKKVDNGYVKYYYEPSEEAYFQLIPYDTGVGTCGKEFTQYVYKYTENDVYAYVYSNVGYYNCQSGLYKDYEQKKEVVSAKKLKKAKLSGSAIAKKYSKLLDKYRVVFKKDGDSYIFDRVEKLDDTKEETKEEKVEETKEEEKEPEKEVEKEVEKEKEEEKVSNIEHFGCNLCGIDGSLCCDTEAGINYEDRLEYVNIANISRDTESMTAKFTLIKDSYKYKVKYIKKNGKEKIEIDGEEIFNKAYIIEDVFVLDNGMIGIQYRDEEDQTMRKMRNYYSRELKLIETIKGINSKVDLFAKKFDYIIASEECIDEKYREIKYYSATINEKDIDTKINKTEKEEGCAGMV